MLRSRLRPLTPVAIALGILLGSVSLTACGGASEEVPSDGAAIDTPAAETPTQTPTESELPAEEPSGGTTGSVCDLISDAEVAAVIGAATVDQGLSFGSLDDDFGGQCVWTAGTTNLELAAWPAGGTTNPAPTEAPAAGSGGFVAIEGGAYYATATHSFRVAVTGSGADAAALSGPVQDLARALQARG